MALNSWWDGDSAQRFWMEIATEEIGDLLQAPTFPGAHWSYELVGMVQEGDRVLHWRSGAGRGLVGWSEITAPPSLVPEYTWQPRGTAGRALPGPRTTEGWVAPAGGLNLFPRPITSEDIQLLADEVVALGAALEAEHGKPTYFPFYLYGGTQIRAQQGYLVKFPVELLGVIPGLDAVRTAVARRDMDDDVEVSEDGQPPRRRAPRGRTTRANDPLLRAAIERRSLDVAIEHYKAMGASDIKELGKPYDLVVQLAGVERHVEVKGSSMLIDAVELTTNEVTHGQACERVDLVVVDGMTVVRDEHGAVLEATGGTKRVWSGWTPEDAALTATKFAYSLPGDA